MYLPERFAEHAEDVIERLRHRAATRIQAVVRGRFQREYFRRLLRAHGLLMVAIEHEDEDEIKQRIDEAMDVGLIDRFLEYAAMEMHRVIEKKNNAATTIQCAVRSRTARRRLRQLERARDALADVNKTKKKYI